MMARMLSRATITLMYRFLSVGIALLASTAYVSPSQAGIVTFGTGANQFQMEFVTIGNPGNAADTTGNPTPAGAVGYTYDIGKFEVSRELITKYNAAAENAARKITLKDMSTLGGNGLNKPATGVTWNEAARFVNWLNTSTGSQAAYKFTSDGVNDSIALWNPGDTGYNSSNPFRNSLATYVLPTYNEWYKAAYYDPNANGSTGTYWKYPTGSNTAPTSVASGTAANTAVYDWGFSDIGPADVTQAGGLSPYGVMGMGGNVYELEESPYDLPNYNPHTARGFRGGAWNYTPYWMLSSTRTDYGPENEYDPFGNNGFRVASLSPSSPPVPEPSTLVIGTLFGLGGLLAKRRMKR